MQGLDQLFCNPVEIDMSADTLGSYLLEESKEEGLDEVRLVISS